ncbi:leucine-rich repeat serine/threonine-protein kinase 1 isoform X1 [Lutzomyia longipalpis]|uniref:leucine-rich repeat serine/threonine-protein kinase 1 isoform X1 n=1 Tax=Lutzomyia longipalpis TaxID=7200 RepID=UPI002483BA08|nr:leucine-rich repeat serine/threonine-protein kinase 1 isoform X1 [Lutzomyia longipalpis]
MSLSPEAEDFPGRLLHQAALWDNVELLVDLLQEEQHLIECQDTFGRTPIHAAAITANSNCLQLLINARANVDAQAMDGKTALHLSAEHGHEQNIDVLLAAGASYTLRDSAGASPFDLAEKFGHKRCMEMLKDAADAFEEIRSLKYRELREAVVSNDEHEVRIILEALGNEREVIVNMAPGGANTLIFSSAQAGNEVIVRMLLEAGADGRAHAVTRYSPLYTAVHNGHVEVTKMLLGKFPELVQQLTVEKWLPLHAACINGHNDVVELLLNYTYPDYLYSTYRDPTGETEWRLAFDPNTQDVTGQTALYVACLLGNKPLVDLLLGWKVKCIKMRDGDVETRPVSSRVSTSPTKRRISYGIQSIMSRLSLGRDAVEEAESESNSWINPLQVDLLCGAARETALLAAVRGGHIDVVGALLQKKADPNVMAKPIEDPNDPKLSDEVYGFSNIPLAEAVRQKSIQMVELLLKYGAKDEQSTALSIACANGNEQIICKLLSIRAHPDPEYKINKKALTSEIELAGNRVSPDGGLTYGSLFPNTSIMINWNNCDLSSIKINFLSEAVLLHNTRLKEHPKCGILALGALTRIDISHNGLTALPPEIFTLCSLRYLNAAQNKIQFLPLPEDIPTSPARILAGSRRCSRQFPKEYECFVLEELYLQDNRLEVLPPALFRMQSLITLDVSNNKLQELPFEMWRAPKLKELNVAFNLLKDLPVLPNQEGGASQSEPASPVTEAFLFNQMEESEAQSRNRTITQVDLVRHHIWSKSLEVTDQEVRLTDIRNDENISQLTSLNLSNNLFTSIPLALPCLAINLTRLSMSYNSLRSMGHVTSYPASLKQLDLGHNEITCWPSLPRIAALDPHLACYNPQEVKPTKQPIKNLTNQNTEVSVIKTNASSGNITSLRTAVLKSVCSHRRHLRLEGLRTLILADNLLTRIQLSTDDVATLSDSEESEWSLVGVTKSRLIFPNLSMLDISNNCLKEIPPTIHELSNLSVLNISGNVDVTELPPHMGLLSRLWNLNTRGCTLQDPLKAMIDSKKYKTMDIIGYLKSVYEDARHYARMKLMVVGVQGIGKTSLLEQLRQEGPNRNKKPVDHWAKRMGHKNINTKTSRGINMSTVGVDIGDWVCEKKLRGHSQHGPVVFRTWDFGGQKEYYATHQYFLSKRSLYLVLWRITDGRRGLAEVLQWLGNIQARAPNSPVIIVGTHYDAVGDTFPAKKAEELQLIIRDRFIAVADAEKMGLPRVLDSIEVSCRTGHNIKLLSNLIYDTAFSLRSPGSKELLLHQKVPASYLALEDVIGTISSALRQVGADPVLDAERYRNMVTQEMQSRGYKRFRDWSELNQATMFLHENGCLLHYDDATLRDLYFLDPQWLCDMLAHVVTVREINPFARSGIMRMDDLQLLFKNSCLGSSDNRGYIVSLLNKFEVALTWDSRTLLIPSLLPENEDTRGGQVVTVKIAARSRGWAMRSRRGGGLASASAYDLTSPPDSLGATQANHPEYDICTLPRPEKVISRLLLMSYFPSGFWSRLITRVLADDQVVDALRNIYPMRKEDFEEPEVNQLLNIASHWTVWQTGLALYHGTTLIFKMREIPPSCPFSPYRNPNNRFKLKQDGVWCDIDMNATSILEITFPMHAIGLRRIDEAGCGTTVKEMEANIQCVSQLVSLSVDHIDILLEDWYPTLGTRFVHTSEGRFLVTRLVPCPKCLKRSDERNSHSFTGSNPPKGAGKFPEKGGSKRLSMERRDFAVGESSGLNELPAILQAFDHAISARKSQDSLGWSDGDSGVGPDSAGSSRAASVEGHPLLMAETTGPPNYCWMVEECILAAYDKKSVSCPVHAEVDLRIITPDIIFLDLSDCYLIRPEDITRGPLLGRGAFGFVFKATCKSRVSKNLIPVAMKMLQPVPPGSRAKESAIIAYKAALGKWERDPLQHSCKAYCTARQELAVLLTLKHPNIVPLVGVCTQPLALVLDLAPRGALDSVLRQYRRNGARIGPYCFQSLVLQAARAMEYLHRRHVIYRDLKAENVLVWDFPEPHAYDHPDNSVHIKVADYGISRVTLPSGAKGFGGTEGFMAPEIMRHNGEEEYTEKVDCFSFGMFLYELLSLRQPFEGHEAVKECILEGGRPVLTQRETQFPCYCLDLMVLCWDQQPKNRPSASQIVSIASAPEFTHLLDVVSLSHTGGVLAGVGYPVVASPEDDTLSYELWLPCSNSRIDLLLGSPKGWQQYHRILCPKISTGRGSTPMKLTTVCVVDTSVWIGDADGNIYGFNASDCTHLFSYALEPTQPSPVVALVHLNRINRVAAGLENGRLFLLDSSNIPTSYVSAEGSFVLTELGSGERLHSVCALWRLDDDVCELWCGETDGAMNVFGLKDSVVSEHTLLNHFDVSLGGRESNVVLLYASEEFVFSCVAPGCILYQWNVARKEIENRLDCSKLIPCSESLRSIAIEEHLSPGKCQITALAVLGNDLYIGTTWGCLIIVEKDTLRPITVFRPFDDEVRCILPLYTPGHNLAPLIVTIGRGYRSLIHRYTDSVPRSITTPSGNERRHLFGSPERISGNSGGAPKDRSSNMHALIWRADHWTPV